ncbi:MAG TPA: hypothetical protein VHY19_03290 [Steroidobacteraceae bacterium]|jgi:hypothetical protein|nr:hypothetical protein [Steroidobacteraceae bacterium]
MKNLLIATAALIAALNLSGCTLVMAGNGYHGDHGDLVSSDGTIRYVGWCDVHPHNSHCLNTPTADTAAISPVTVGAAPVAAVDPASDHAAVTLAEASPDLADNN